MRDCNFCRIAIGLFLILITHHLDARKNDWEDPTVFAVNKLPPRATLYPYGWENNNVLKKELSGEKWPFYWVGDERERLKDFYQLEFNDQDWEQIEVLENLLNFRLCITIRRIFKERFAHWDNTRRRIATPKTSKNGREFI